MPESNYPLIAKTISGLEETLAEELSSIGATDVMILNRAVSFTGNRALLYRANYECRTALRILRPLFHFEITDQAHLYEQIRAYPWEQILDADKTISIDAVISYTVFTNSQYVAQKSKDAIADRFRDIAGRRPSVDLENPDVRINVHLFKDSCTVALDSSGQSLHRRGYRKSTGPAPINEVLAAGLIRLSGWTPDMPLLDPMCGAGTILIEAAMIARHIPAGYFRDRYGFMNWNDYDANLWREVKGVSDGAIGKEKLEMTGFDRSRRAIISARENLKFAGLDRDIETRVVSFEESEPPFAKGCIITNPPYDERIKVEDSVAFHQMVGTILKRRYSGYTAWLISSDLDAIKFIGLRPSRKIKIYNGPLECRFLKFELFTGKKGYQQTR